MANKYLTSLLNVLSAVQARQISELLQDLQVAGTIRSSEEYSDKLAELSTLVNGTSPIPSFSPLYSVVWNLCSSDAHNIMVKSIKNDLEAAFIQLDDIGSKLDDHHILFMKNLIADLNKGINKQEENIKKLELIANQNNEFTDVMVNTFAATSTLGVSLAEQQSDLLLFDNRTYQILDESNIDSAVISEAESLILGVNENIGHRVNAISVKLQSDEYSYITEREVDSDADLGNIIDGKIGTFWTRSVNLIDPVSEVHTVLDFNLGAAKDISYVVIQPASSEPFYVTDITGVSVNGSRVSLLSEDRLISGITRIDFDRVNLVSVLIILSNKTYQKAQYFTNSTYSITEDKEKDWVERTQMIANATGSAIQSEVISEICNVPSLTETQVNYNTYSFAIDNIYFGNPVYSNVGTFLTKPLRLVNPGTIAVKVNEKAEIGTIQNSIEYDVIKVDKSPRYKETRFPIPYLGQESVNSERLILISKSSNILIKDIGKLRFLPNLSETFQIYKNEKLLSIGTDYLCSVAQISKNESETFDWKASLSAIDYQDYDISPLGFYIKILNPNMSDVYTINYSIFTSETEDSSSEFKTIWLNKDNTISLADKGHINILKNENYPIESEIYLQITLRRNQFTRSTTPELYECILLANKYNE